MKNVVGRISFLAVCLLILLQISCDDKDKLESFLDNEKPSVVTGLKASEITPESLTLSWDAAIDNVEVTGYEIFLDGESYATVGNKTSHTIDGLSPSNMYEFYIIAMDAMENTSDPSETLSVATPEDADTQSPTAPSNLATSKLTEGSVTLSWETSTDNVEVVDYQVFQDGSSIGLTDGETTFDVSGLIASTQYEFYIIATDAAGNLSEASNTVSVTTSSDQDTEAPSSPTNLNANEITATSLVLNWSASTDNEAVDAYEVYNGDTSIGNTSNTSFNISNLDPDTNYQFRVRAIDNSENVSEFSNVLEVKTLQEEVEPTQTVAQIIASRNDLSTLNQVLSNYDFGLDDEEDGPFTVFAPNNNAFTSFGTLPSGLALNALIAGHVVGGELSAAELVEQQSATTGSQSTLNFTQDGTDVIINGNVRIVIKDIKATNGIIHIVDRVIND
ncbi:fibronectin type iii domain protein [Galbibacter marinus]|uniref:Fibronectin type iii domain protein n=1 Tax=Galbibacter marinus TaxID=555500 RepID=K2QNG1_9FLAO|nr:fibronectin type III domain-containing protein [Galbibacter marinus]EKF56407.1 fibronectin type iii domain protein [Galbibacter marinus]